MAKKGATIAFSGKGGSGKTTLSALVLREMLRRECKPILAVDADPNATLALSLGVEAADTIADLRDRMGEAAQKVSEISKDRLMDQWLPELLSEQAGFDLLTMGRPEGPKCYCYVNGLLRRYLGLLRQSYPYMVVDCEAGMEYFSRLTVDDIDTLVMVAEGSTVGLTTVSRIGKLADSLPIRVGRRVLALNKVGGVGMDCGFPSALVEGLKIDAVVEVPFDKDLAVRSAHVDPIDAEAGAAARAAIEKLTDRCLSLSGQSSEQTIRS